MIAGCGYVGTALAARLAAGGDRVWGLRRNPSQLPDRVQPLAADLLQPLPRFPARFDYACYTAGSGGFSEAAYRAAYVDGLRNLIAALKAQGQSPRRIIFTSSTAVYVQQNGELLDEDDPTVPQRFSGRVLLEAETVLQAGPFPATVLRLGGIYGPGRAKLVEGVRNGTAACEEGPPRILNLIHRDDCAGALEHLMRMQDPGGLYLGVDHEPFERNALLRWIATQLGKPEPPRIAPGADAETQRGGNRRFSNARLVASGYRFRYPSFRDGFATLA